MKKEELQAIIFKLQELRNNFETDEDNIDNLMRLALYMGDLRKYPKYFERAEGILDMIEEYQLYSKDDFIYVIESTIKNLTTDVENMVEVTIFGTIKRGYKDVKGIVSELIPENVKNKYAEAINTANTIGVGIVYTIKQEAPQYNEKIKQFKGTTKKIEKRVKSKLRNWLLSEDREEDN